MAGFPNELLLKICSHAPIATLKQLRYVNRNLSDIAAEHLFEEIEFILLPESIEKAQKIMGHPKFRHHVTTLRYFGERLNPSMMDFEWWEAHALHVSTGALSADTYACWDRFCHLSSEKSRLIIQGAETGVFQVAIRQLPKLYIMELRDSDWARFEGRHRTPYHDIAQKTLLMVYNAFASANAEYDPNNSPHLSLLSALHSTKNEIKALYLEDVPWASCSDITSALFNLSIPPLITPILRNLRSLGFNFWVDQTFMPLAREVTGEVSVLCDLLCKAPLLENLVLHPYQIYADQDATGHISEAIVHTDATDIFLQLTWRNLRQLTISNFLIGTEAFIEFMHRHASTLKDLKLHNIKLTDSPIGGPKLRTITRAFVTDYPSAWEWAMLQLVPAMHLEHCHLKMLADDELLNRIDQGDQNGISVQWLVRSWRMELSLYCGRWDADPRRRPYFPVYGQPRVIEYEDEKDDEDDG